MLRLRRDCLLSLVVLTMAFGATIDAESLSALAAQRSSDSGFAVPCTVAPEDAACVDCLSFSTLATLGHGSGEGFLEDHGTIADVVRDTSGNLWVGQRNRIKVFDSKGRYLRTVGRAGEGPGEYVFAQPRMVDRDGNIHVVDVRQFRVTVLSPDGEVVETWRMPFPPRYTALFADGDRLLGAHWDASPERLGLPLHVISSDGSVVNSFGAPTGATTLREDADLAVAVDPGGLLYSARIDEYHINVWTSDGEKLTTITGPALNPDGVTRELDSDFRPRNRIRTIAAPIDGILAVVARLRRDDWREGTELRTSSSGRVSHVPKSFDFSHWYYSRLDIIDVHRCDVIASVEYDGLLTRFLNANEILALRKTELGEALLDLTFIHGLREVIRAR